MFYHQSVDTCRDRRESISRLTGVSYGDAEIMNKEKMITEPTLDHARFKGTRRLSLRQRLGLADIAQQAESNVP